MRPLKHFKSNYFLNLRRQLKEFYETYAEEFHHTRLNPWKEVTSFYDLLKNDTISCDIGCGNGRHTKDLIKFSSTVLGIDFSFNILKIAKRRFLNNDYRFHPIVADALYLPIRDNTIDSIVSIALVHHIAGKLNRIRFLRECKRIIKEKGLIILSAWSILNIRNLLLSLRYFIFSFRRPFIDFGDAFVLWAGKFPRYYHFYSKRDIKVEFNKAGLKIISIMQFGKFPSRKNFLAIALKA